MCSQFMKGGDYSILEKIRHLSLLKKDVFILKYNFLNAFKIVIESGSVVKRFSKRANSFKFLRFLIDWGRIVNLFLWGSNFSRLLKRSENSFYSVFYQSFIPFNSLLFSVNILKAMLLRALNTPPPTFSWEIPLLHLNRCEVF